MTRREISTPVAVIIIALIFGSWLLALVVTDIHEHEVPPPDGSVIELRYEQGL